MDADDLINAARAAAHEADACGFLALDRTGHILAADTRATEILTMHDRPLPLTILDVVDLAPRKRLMRAFRDLSASLTHRCRLHVELAAPMRAMQFVRLDLSVRQSQSGSITQLLATLTDTTAREQFELRRRREEKRLRATVDNVAVGMISTDWNGQFLEVNRQFARMIGYEPRELIGRNFRDFMHPDDLTPHSNRRAALWRGQIPSVVIDRRWLNRHGDIVWLRMTISVQDDLVDSEPYSVVILEDISDAKRMEESQALLVGELNHRVKNTLAVVQGIVRKTLATAPNPRAFAEQIEQRLQSISRAHDLLSQNDWVDLGLIDLIQTTLLDAFPLHAQAFEIDLPSVNLSPHQAISLTLILHELATNALKYGALKTETGKIALSGQVIQSTLRKSIVEHELTLSWMETGGPPIAKPDHSGFGQFLLKRGATHSLNGTANIEFRSTGLCFNLKFPIEADQFQNLSSETIVPVAFPPATKNSDTTGHQNAFEY